MQRTWQLACTDLNQTFVLQLRILTKLQDLLRVTRATLGAFWGINRLIQNVPGYFCLLERYIYFKKGILPSFTGPLHKEGQATELQLQLDFVSPILAYFPTNQSGFQHSVCGLSTKINHYWFTARLLLVKTCSRLLNQINLDNLQCQMKLRQNTHTHKTHPNTFSVLGHLQIILHGSDSFEFVYLRVRTP